MENKLSYKDFLSINMIIYFLLSKQISILKIILFIILVYIELALSLNYNSKQIYINQKIYNIRIENHLFQFSYFNYSGYINNLYPFLKENDYININNSLSISVDFDNFIKSIDFLVLNFEKTKIENIFNIIIIFPLLKENCTILYQIENKNILNKYKNTFKGIKISKNLYINYLNDLIDFIDNFKILYFEWEIIPDNYLTNSLRYIINNYYNETILNIFDKSFNLNLKRYIKIKRNNLSFNELNNMMSK